VKTFDEEKGKEMIRKVKDLTKLAEESAFSLFLCSPDLLYFFQMQIGFWFVEVLALGYLQALDNIHVLFLSFEVA